MKRNNNLITSIIMPSASQKEYGIIARRNLKVEEAALQWLDNTKLRVKESTYVKYNNLVRKHIIPQLGGMRMSRLSTDVVEDFVRQKLTSGRRKGTGGLSEKTVKDMITVLKQICLYAAYWNIEAPCHFELIRLKKCDKEVHVLDKRDQTRLEEFLMRDESLTKTGVLLSLYMGLRLGEVCALRKNNILQNDKILQVRFTMQRIQNVDGEGGKKTKIIVTEPKSSSSIRDIPIPTFLMRRLEILDNADDNAYVLTGDSSEFIEPRTMENIFKRYLKECQMDVINYHALRHTFATRCIESGFDVKSLSEILGHANVNITLNRYVHSSMEQKRKCMNGLAE